MRQGLGDRIKVLREEMDISQEELAKILGIDRASLSQIENGKRSVKAEELSSISKALNVSADMLLGLTSSPEIFLEKNQDQPMRSIRINVPQKRRISLRKFYFIFFPKLAPSRT
jgi:Plasmid maintenance system antidote protein